MKLRLLLPSFAFPLLSALALPAQQAASPTPFRVRYGAEMSGRTKEWPSNPTWKPRPEDVDYFTPGAH